MDENKNKIPFVFLVLLLTIVFFVMNYHNAKLSDIGYTLVLVIAFYQMVVGFIINVGKGIAEWINNLKRDSDRIRMESGQQIEKPIEIFKWVLLICGAIFILSPIIALYFPTFPNYAGMGNMNAQIPNGNNTDGNNSLNSSSLPINPLSEYNYKTKKEIYEIRKNHVMNSIFANPNYQPNEEVFGQIGDGKPWYGMGIFPCKIGDVTKGISYRSKFINNPSLLIDVSNDIAYPYSKDDPFCKDAQTWTLLADQLTYDKKQKLITVTYKVDNTFLRNNPKKNSPTLDFGAINARDFGYSYGYASRYNNMEFDQSENLSTEVYKFKDFIHTGGSCGVSGGCNNQSPWQREVDFHLTSLPASITFKLWKNEPRSQKDQPDIYYMIVMEDKNGN